MVERLLAKRPGLRLAVISEEKYPAYNRATWAQCVQFVFCFVFVFWVWGPFWVVGLKLKWLWLSEPFWDPILVGR